MGWGLGVGIFNRFRGGGVVVGLFGELFWDRDFWGYIWRIIVLYFVVLFFMVL